MNAAAARQALTSSSTVSIGLLVTIIAVVFYAGVSWHQIGANAEDIEQQEDKINTLQTTVTRGLVVDENTATALAEQAIRLKSIEDAQNRQLVNDAELRARIDALIRALERQGGSVGGMPP